VNPVAEPKRCTRCVLPENFRNISFDADGVCNYCHNHEKYIGFFRRYALAEEMFLQQVQANRGKYRDDCAAGLSGGKDSCYVLYQLVKKYKLNVLAITTDNGWLEERARDNIKKVVSDLGIDHVVLRLDQAQQYRLYKAAGIQCGWPCIACSFLGIALVQRYCFDHKIPFCVHGRARSQMLRELSRYSHDSYLPHYGMVYRPYNFAAVLKSVRAGREQLDGIIGRLIPGEQERREFIRKYVVDPAACEREHFAPQFVAYFLMEDYNRKKVMEFMESTILGNRKMVKPDHSDCRASEAFMHIYKQAFGWSLLELEIAFDVRDGKVSRDDALERIRGEKAAFELPRESFDLVCAKLDADPEELLDGLDIARKNIKNYQRIKKIKNFFVPALRVEG
jgi:hypothetical protein